jgi:hypothetical protein
MNIGSAAARKKPSETRRPDGAQLSLPLEVDSREDALRLAWARSGLSLPYHVAMRNRPLAICLGCLADAIRNKASTDCANSRCESNRTAYTRRSWSKRSKPQGMSH